MPVLKSTIDDKLLSKGLDQYTLDSVSEYNQALKLRIWYSANYVNIDDSQFAWIIIRIILGNVSFFLGTEEKSGREFMVLDGRYYIRFNYTWSIS